MPNAKDPNHKSSMGFMKDLEEKKREDDLNILNKTEQAVSMLLGELQYISELLGHHKQIAKVENLEKKLQKAYKKIQDYLNPDLGEENKMEMNNKQSAGVSLEKHPLLQDMGGMPLEQISPEWQEMMNESKIQDKAELQNQLRNKLKNKLDLAMKLVSKLQNRLKATSKPQLQPINQLVIKYKETLDLKVKPILEQVPKPAPAPEPTPRPVPKPSGPSPF